MMMRWVLSSACALMLAACTTPGMGPPIPAPPFPEEFAQLIATQTTSACVTGRPTADFRGIARSYPTPALIQNREGWAVIQADVSADGAVINPRVLAEAPLGFGFGEAAATAVTKMVYPPQTQSCADLVFKVPFLLQ